MLQVPPTRVVVVYVAPPTVTVMVLPASAVPLITGVVSLVMAALVIAGVLGATVSREKLLELGVPMVTLFHLTRVLMLVLFGGAMYRWLAPRFGWPADEVPVPARPPRDDENE